MAPEEVTVALKALFHCRTWMPPALALMLPLELMVVAPPALWSVKMPTAVTSLLVDALVSAPVLVTEMSAPEAGTNGPPTGPEVL
ncbi:hypothetical protein D3C72_2041200 [compost metagenome]